MSQFPGHTPRTIKHTYSDADPSPWMRFNRRDAADVTIETANAQPSILVASTAAATIAGSLESVANMVGNSIAVATPSMTVAFVSTWAISTGVQLIFRAIVALLRSHGESIFRDAVAWFWALLFHSFLENAKSYFFGWWPFGRRRAAPRRPARPDRPQPDGVTPSPGRRTIRDRIQRRREQRGEA